MNLAVKFNYVDDSIATAWIKSFMSFSLLCNLIAKFSSQKGCKSAIKAWQTICPLLLSEMQKINSLHNKLNKNVPIKI